MLKRSLKIIALSYLYSALAFGLNFHNGKQKKQEASTQNVKALIVTSKDIHAGQQMSQTQVFNSFGCSGANHSPDLSWTGAPPETKAYAVTVFDPDAPTGSGWWHWVLYNIPSNINHLAAGVGVGNNPVPFGAKEGRTDFGKPGYGGPCPPPGAPHRYIFKVFALKDKITVDDSASPAMVSFNIHQLKLAEGSLEAKYGR